jgi:hypothetical protein
MHDHLEAIEHNVLKLQAEEQKERGSDTPAVVRVGAGNDLSTK